MSGLTVALGGLSGFILLVLVRVVMGPTIWDRLLGLNMVSAKIVMAIVVLAVMTQRSYLMDIALVYTILGFVGTVLIARFVEKKGKI